MTRFSKTSRCRATGFLVSVEHAEDAGLDTMLKITNPEAHAAEAALAL